jgi:hypothetical protein
MPEPQGNREHLLKVRSGTMSQVRKRWSRIAGLWCSLMHEGATWPIHGRYQCSKCHRVISAPWD